MKSFFAGMFMIALLTSTAIAQNVCEIYCTAFAQGRVLNQVNYKLTLNDQVVEDEVMKNGMYQFVMKKEDGQYVLEISKSGFLTKLIRINTADYPFQNEYEIQEIDLDFVKPANGESMQLGQLKWSELTDEFSVSKIDTALERLKENYSHSKQKLDQLYVQAIVNGNEMMNMGEPTYAKGYFEIALGVKENDEYANSKLVEIQMAVAAKKEKEKNKEVVIDTEMMDKINKGEIENIEDLKAEENVRFSVQLGAFSKSINMRDFANVPDFKKIEYEDYTRCFSGEFIQLQDAMSRKKEMVNAGYKDAWIVKLKGNERIGF